MKWLLLIIASIGGRVTIAQIPMATEQSCTVAKQQIDVENRGDAFGPRLEVVCLYTGAKE